MEKLVEIRLAKFPYDGIWIILFIVFCQSSFSQEFIVKGQVLHGETKEPIEGVICKIYDSKDEMIAYTLSSNLGEVILDTEKSPSYVVFSYLGFQNEKVPYVDFLKNNVVQLFTKAIEIDEIIIKSQAITQDSDTINYSVDPFKSIEDRYLKDVLQKLPGITISATGAINYQGKPINKFYMEGLDLLGSQYTIASNNLPIDAVQAVQVIENNQHIKALNGIEFSENAALNIRLKEGFKHRSFGEIRTAFGGSPILSSTKLFGTLIAKNSQTLATIKIDNTGVRIERETRELLEFTDLFSFDNPVKMHLGNMDIHTVPMNEKRYLLNETYLGTINHLEKLSKDVTLRFKMDVTKDQTQQDSYYTSIYDLMGDELLTIEEVRGVRMSNTRLNAAVNYEKNSAAVFLKNELKARFDWQTSQENLLLGQDQFYSNLSQNKVTIQNRFSYLFGKSSSKYTLDAFIKYVDQPESIFLESTKTENAVLEKNNQRIAQEHLLFKVQIGTKKRLFSNPLTLNMETFYNNDVLKTNLETKEKFNFLDRYLYINRVRLKKYGSTFTTAYTYYFKDGNLGLAIPFKYEQHSVSNRIGIENRELANFWITPSLSFTYNWKTLWKINANTAYNESVSQIDNYYQGIMMTTYRDFMTYDNLPQKYKSMRYELGLEHRNPLTSVFFNLNIGYQPTKIDVYNPLYYDKEYTLTSYIRQNMRKDRLYLNARVSKLVSELKTTFAISTSYDYNKSDVLQQNTLFVNYSNQWSIGLEAYIKKLDWMSIQYTVYDNVFWESNAFKTTDKLHNITQLINISFFTLKKLQLQLSGEHNYNDMGEKESYKNIFVDATASYKLQKLEFTMLIQNLLDEREYSFTNYSGLNSTSLKIPIRGRSILLGATFSF